MTRAKVFQLALIVLISGPFVYELFIFSGIKSIHAGIITQLLLLLIVVAWTISYLVRVFTGRMTFVEQRKRYRKAYEDLTDSKLIEKYDALSEKDKIALMEMIEKEKNE